MAYYSLREIDPTFQLGTYYSIMGIVISAVPVVTSYLILGSLKGGAGLISSGVQSYSNVTKSSAQNAQQQMAITGIRLENRKMEADAALRSQLNVNQGLAMNAGSDEQGTTNYTPASPALGMTPSQQSGLSREAGIASAALSGAFGSTTASRIADSVSSSAASLRDKELDRIAKWGQVNAVNSQYYQRLFSTGRVYGMYEIALAEGPPIDKELDFELEWLKSLSSMTGAALPVSLSGEGKGPANFRKSVGQLAGGAAGVAAVGAIGNYAGGGKVFRGAEAARGDMSFGAIPDGEIAEQSYFKAPINYGDGEIHGRSREGRDIDAESKEIVKNKALDIAKEEGLSTDQQAIFLATIDVESGFNPDAANRKSSASGLGQFIDDTGAAYGLDGTNNFKIEDNARALAKFMKKETLPFAERKSDNFAEIASWSYAYHHDGGKKQDKSDGLAVGRKAGVAAKAEAYRRELNGQTEIPLATNIGRSTKPSGS
jgi:Transglycosylase SLT domain